MKNVTNTKVERFTVLEPAHGEAAPTAAAPTAAIVTVIAEECGLCTDPVLSTEEYKQDPIYGISHTECLARDSAEAEKEPAALLSEAEMVLQMVAHTQGSGTDEVRHVHVAYLSDYNKQGSVWFKNKSTGAPRVTCNRISPLTLDYLEIVRRENADLIEGKFGTFLFTAFGPQGKITDWVEDIAKPIAPIVPQPAIVSRETSADAQGGLAGFVAQAKTLGEAIEVLGYQRSSASAGGNDDSRRSSEEGGEGPRTRTALAEMLEILNVADALKKRFGDNEKEESASQPLTLTPGVPGESPWVKDAVAIGQATGLSELLNHLARNISGPAVSLAVGWVNSKLNEKRAEAGKAAEESGARQPQLSARPESTGDVSRETSRAAAPPEPTPTAAVDPNAMPFLMAIVEDLERAEPGECDVTKAVGICVQALQFAPEQSRPFFDELLRLSPIELVLWLSQQNSGNWRHLIKLRQAAEFCESWQNDLREVLEALDGDEGTPEADSTLVGAPTNEVVKEKG